MRRLRKDSGFAGKPDSNSDARRASTQSDSHAHAYRKPQPDSNSHTDNTQPIYLRHH